MQKITTKFTNKPETKKLLTEVGPCIFFVVKHITTGEKQIAMKIPSGGLRYTYLFISNGDAEWEGEEYANKFIILNEEAELNIKITPSN